MNMTAKEFTNWQTKMARKYPEKVRMGSGLQIDCAKLLGVDRKTVLRYEKNGATMLVHLACKALLAGLDEPEKKEPAGGDEIPAGLHAAQPATETAIGI